uniref:Centromere protein J C-terminal domain-containing protein n=1 Tax=Stomoxys calcitrans TaxID=35570 RepID=A0A1I8PBB7_STOCA
MLKTGDNNKNSASTIPMASLFPGGFDANVKKSDIVKRLEELNKWKEEQEKLLSLRQDLQRQMLGMEQKTMYQMLGLSSGENVLNEIEEAEGNAAEALNAEEFQEYEESILEFKNAEEEEVEEDDGVTHPSAAEPSSYRTLTSGYATEECMEAPSSKPKRPFLKRGQGLKQRFKIDPEELRITNLPRYKYANAHPKLKLKPRKLPNHLVKKNSIPGTVKAPSPKDVGLDVHEKRFQQLLISSKNVCNSTPENKSSLLSSKNLSGASSNASTSLPRVRFVETSLKVLKQHSQEYTPSEGSSITRPTTVAWSKILDSQQIKPLPVVRKNVSPNLPQSEQDIFELLEEKANNGSFDMNSTCMKQFLQRRLNEHFNETDIIPISEGLKQKRLQPLVEAVDHEQSSASLEEAEENDTSIAPGNSECGDDDTTHRTLETTNNSTTYYPPRSNENRVRFSDSHDTREYGHEETACTDSSQLTAADGIGNSELFEQFKQALFAALQSKADQHNETMKSASETTLTPQDYFVGQEDVETEKASAELQEKTNMIKERLLELEKEIATFKQNNIQLLKAKQEYELEKSLHAQEQLEAAERLKDERIQMEIYLHDERMKLEEEKRKFEQQIKMKSQSLASKERKEMEKLREQVAQLETQLKNKECNHAAAQARWRTQIRTMEREEKRLHEQIEILTKENKRLENEMLKVSRENNNKLLQEINRNIAKLAPKQTQHDAVAFPEDSQPPVLGSSRSLSKTIVATAATNKNSKSPSKGHTITAHKRIARKSTKPTNNQLSKQSHPLPETPSSGESDTSCNENNKCSRQSNKKQQPQKHFVEFDEDEEDILEELKTCLVKNKSQAVTKEESLSAKHQEESPRMDKAPPSSPTNMKREIVNADGSKDIWYPNGNLKKISADGMLIRMLYYNKDIKETNINEGTVKYYYAETNTWHTTYLDGLEILEFPNGQIEHRHKNGLVEVHYPNNSVKIMDPRDEKKLEEWRFADGTHLVQMRNGDKILSLPNGQKEIHTKLQKRREYPDGTVKIVYPDGSTETRYSNGRVRLKDKDGNLVMDTEEAK